MCVCVWEVVALCHTEGRLMTPSPQQAPPCRLNPFHTQSTGSASPSQCVVVIHRRECPRTGTAVSGFWLLSLSFSLTDSTTPALSLISLICFPLYTASILPSSRRRCTFQTASHESGSILMCVGMFSCGISERTVMVAIV